MPAKPAPAFWKTPTCGRRRRVLAPLARDIVLAKGDGRALTPAAWIGFLGLAYLLAQPAELGFYVIPGAALFLALCLLALFDFRYFIIPDGPIWFLLLSGAATVLLGAPKEAPGRIAAAAVGFLSLWLVDRAYEKLRGAPGVGEADAKLFAVAGLWLGFRGLPSCLLFAVLSALVSAVVSIRAGSLQNAREPLPFGPHLALGLWLVWVFGPLEVG